MVFDTIAFFQFVDFTHLKIYDGNSTHNDVIAFVHHSQYSYYLDVKSITSSSHQVFLTFTVEAFVKTGFSAKILQTSNENLDPKAKFCTVTNPCKVNEGHCYHNQQCSKGLSCGHDNCPDHLGYANKTNCCYEHCQEWLDLENGILTSPNYPNSYPNNVECSWTITALHNQTVAIQFLDFEVNTYLRILPVVISI